MKKLFLLLVLIVTSCTQVFCQRNTICFTPYNYSDAGRYLSLVYSKEISERSSISGGVLFHLNNRITGPDRRQDLYLHHRFKAYETIEHFGLSMGYEHKLFDLMDKKVTFFAYDQLMLRRMGAHTAIFVPVDTFLATQPDGSILYEEFAVVQHTNIRSLLSIENIVGLGVSGKLTKQLGVQMRAGIGFNYISNLPKPLFESGRVFQYSIQTSVGLSYSF